MFAANPSSAELPSPQEIVSLAGKACADALSDVPESRKPSDPKERFELRLRERAWFRLALARVQIGDFDGAGQALNRVNSDPRFSQMSVQTMRTELTGEVSAWPDDLTPALKDKQRQVLADVLKDRGRFAAALEMAEEITSEQTRAWQTARIVLARSRTLEATDRNAALKDQLEAMELANAIGDGARILTIHYEVCLGQIRMGPVEAARPTIQACIQSFQKMEQGIPLPTVISEWSRFGKLCLLTSDERTAERCFDHARDLYRASNRGKEWEQSVTYQMIMRYRCEAHRENKQLETIPQVLSDWQEAFAEITAAREISIVAPFLICELVESDLFDQAEKIIQGLDDPTQVLVVQKAAELIQKSAAAAHRTRFADYVKTLQPDAAQFHLAMLVVAAELVESAGDKPAADQFIDQALAISIERNKEDHLMVAGWLSENGRFEKAHEVIDAIEDPKRKAQTLAELAYQVTKPKAPPSARASE